MESLRKHAYDPDCLNNISVNKYGRPFLDQSIDFNISHSGEYVCCAITDFGRLGIDIEKIRSINISEFRSFLSPEQIEFIKGSPNVNEEFYRFWTRCESILKADGRGLSIPFSEIYTDGSKVILNKNVWFVNRVYVDSDYSCHLATNIKNPKIDIKKIEFN